MMYVSIAAMLAIITGGLLNKHISINRQDDSVSPWSLVIRIIILGIEVWMLVVAFQFGKTYSQVSGKFEIAARGILLIPVFAGEMIIQMLDKQTKKERSQRSGEGIIKTSENGEQSEIKSDTAKAESVNIPSENIKTDTPRTVSKKFTVHWALKWVLCSAIPVGIGNMMFKAYGLALIDIAGAHSIWIFPSFVMAVAMTGWYLIPSRTPTHKFFFWGAIIGLYCYYSSINVWGVSADKNLQTYMYVFGYAMGGWAAFAFVSLAIAFTLRQDHKKANSVTQ